MQLSYRGIQGFSQEEQGLQPGGETPLGMNCYFCLPSAQPVEPRYGRSPYCENNDNNNNYPRENLTNLWLSNLQAKSEKYCLLIRKL